MNRKEIMIAAVLVNAGLLIVLFASALKTDSKESTALVKEPTVLERASEVVAQNQEAVVVGSEVDRAVQTLAAAQAQPVMETPAPSFVEDIKAIAAVETTQTATLADPTVQTLVAPIAKEQKLRSNVVEVKVKKGDVLEKIARHNHSTVAEIMKANHLTSSSLRIGQVLKVPQKGVAEMAAAPTPANPSGQEKYYVVKKGDSPWTIAVQNHMKVEELLKLNQMTDAQAKRLKPGDKIRIQ
jgi:LysM repeat protein